MENFDFTAIIMWIIGISLIAFIAYVYDLNEEKNDEK